MTTSTAGPTPLVAGFLERGRQLAARDADWLGEMRLGALSRFEGLGWPTPALESWRTTNLAPITGVDFAPAGALPATAGLLDRLPRSARVELGGPRLVFVDGRFAPELSSAPQPSNGLWLGSLAQAREEVPERLRPQLNRLAFDEMKAFDALNLALTEDGAVILLDRGVDAGLPIQLLFVGGAAPQATVSHPRTVILAGAGSRLQVVETYAGAEGVYFTNASTHLLAEDGAQVDHCRVQLESPAAFHISSLHSRQTRDSNVTLHNLNLGGRLVRHNVVSVLDGEGANCRMYGLYLTRDEQQVDNHTVLDHAKPHGSSRELYKGILTGHSRAIFNGRIVVRRDAQRTDAKQSNPNLLLSAGALANTRPQLEIYADDVKCTHGATIGRLDEEAIFYLRARGIDEVAARNLMIEAFAGEVLDALPAEPLRLELARAVAERLPRGA